MSIVNWNKNINFLESIVTEYIQEAGLGGKKDKIFQYFHYVVNKYHGIRFEYKNVMDLNKSILQDVSEYLQQVKTKKKPKVQEIYNREDIIRNRHQSFEREYEMKKNDFEKYTNKKQVEEIDFRDKTKDPNINIDDLMEQITQERDKDLTSSENVDEKRVKEWITNGGDIQENMNNFILEKQGDMTQPLQKKVKSEIIDQLAEEMIHQRKYDTYPSILKTDNSSEPKREKSVSFEEPLSTFKNKIKRTNETIQNEITMRNIYDYIQQMNDTIQMKLNEISLRINRLELSGNILDL